MNNQREAIYQEYFHWRLMDHLQVGVTPQYLRLERVYWWTLYYLEIEPVGHFDVPTPTEVN